MESEKIIVRGSWVINAEREAIYTIISDFERMPECFPKVARSMRIMGREGNRFSIEAEAASFGWLFPKVKVSIIAELLPGRGYRCRTRNLTFNTTGEEELLLVDDPAGTRVEYCYLVTVQNARLRPLYRWLTQTFGLPYWKRSFVDRLKTLVAQ